MPDLNAHDSRLVKDRENISDRTGARGIWRNISPLILERVIIFVWTPPIPTYSPMIIFRLPEIALLKERFSQQ
jgi:hypothetical protein